jgi:hypothetical protein
MLLPRPVRRASLASAVFLVALVGTLLAAGVGPAATSAQAGTATDLLAAWHAALNQSAASWTAPTRTVTGYLVQTYDVTPGHATTFVAQQAVSQPSATITGLTGGHSYAFAVYASNSAGSSAPAASNTVTLR